MSVARSAVVSHIGSCTPLNPAIRWCEVHESRQPWGPFCSKFSDALDLAGDVESAAVERIADEVAALADRYPEDIWTPIGPPEDGPYSTDRIAAHTMRHAARMFSDFIRNGDPG